MAAIAATLQWPWQNQRNLSVLWLARVHWVALRPCASPRHGRGVLPSLGHARQPEQLLVACLKCPWGLLVGFGGVAGTPPILMPPKHMQSTMHQWAPMGLHAALVANGMHARLGPTLPCTMSLPVVVAMAAVTNATGACAA